MPVARHKWHKRRKTPSLAHSLSLSSMCHRWRANRDFKWICYGCAFPLLKCSNPSATEGAIAWMNHFCEENYDFISLYRPLNWNWWLWDLPFQRGFLRFCLSRMEFFEHTFIIECMVCYIAVCVKSSVNRYFKHIITGSKTTIAFLYLLHAFSLPWIYLGMFNILISIYNFPRFYLFNKRDSRSASNVCIVYISSTNIHHESHGLMWTCNANKIMQYASYAHTHFVIYM